MPTLTKAELIEKVCENLPCTKKDACEMVEKLIEKMKETLCTGDEILISGFGKFSVKSKKERVGRNPATGESMVLPARRVVRFKGSGKIHREVEFRFP